MTLLLGVTVYAVGSIATSDATITLNKSDVVIINKLGLSNIVITSVGCQKEICSFKLYKNKTILAMLSFKYNTQMTDKEVIAERDALINDYLNSRLTAYKNRNVTTPTGKIYGESKVIITEAKP